MATEGRIDLTKKVGIVLEKRKLFNLMVKVGAAFDVSGSTQKLFLSGVMQRAITRVFAIADKVDDNHTLDSWIFASKSKEMVGIDPDNYTDYASAVIADSDEDAVREVLWGGTYIAPYAAMVNNFYNPTVEVAAPVVEESTGFLGKVKALFGGGKKASVPLRGITDVVEEADAAEPELPAYMMTFTDGDNSDESATEAVIGASRSIFWMFVGVGDENFAFLKRLALKYDHVGFVDVRDLDALSADQLYEALITEKFANWIKKNHSYAIDQAGHQREQGK